MASYGHTYRGYLLLNNELLTDITSILKTSRVTVSGKGGFGHPVVTGSEVTLNGDWTASASRDDLTLVDGVNHTTRVDTAFQPYNEVIGAVLLRASFYSKRFKVSSDGDFEDGYWTRARQLYFDTFGVDAVKPEEIESSLGARVHVEVDELHYA
jgi:hypothetical protein